MVMFRLLMSPTENIRMPFSPRTITEFPVDCITVACLTSVTVTGVTVVVVVIVAVPFMPG